MRRRDPREDGPAVRFARWAGVAYTSAGIVGFAVTGVHQFTRRSGEMLLGVELNPLLNTVHLAAGLILLAASASSVPAARTATHLAAAAFGVVGLLGIALVGTPANVLAVNGAGNLLHLATAGAATACAFAAGRHAAEHRQGRPDPRTLWDGHGTT
ncbi:DUF4383 domain-containing protein [Nitriliruptoraceae bacterium ZYF776]|nr:DUF4383 domain-containing protein [Profundirhabdus halotolerans]